MHSPDNLDGIEPCETPPPPPPPSYVVSSSEEYVFQRMATRKLERKLRGTYKTDKPWTLMWTFLILLLLLGIVAPNFVNDENSQRSFDIRINFRNVGFLSFLAVVSTVLLVFALTRVVVVVRWSLYWLLATLSVLYLWNGNINLFSEDTPMPLFVCFAVLEFSTFALHVCTRFIYPRQKFTMTYDSELFGFETRRSCTYRGELDSEGLPHGFGNWLDDSYHGELLSGVWERGEPVGPFRSREFGSGYAFESLRVGYVHCSDDTVVSRNWFPSQDKLPTIGVASVECSVAGGFFSHLPRATILDGPYCLASLFYSSAEQEANPFNGWEEEQEEDHEKKNPYFAINPHRPLRRVQDLVPQLKVLFTEHPSSSLIITATRDRGVLVSGHTLEDQDSRPNQLVIDIVRNGNAVATNAEQESFAYFEHDENTMIQGEEDTLDDTAFHTPLLNSPEVPLYFDLSRIHSATLQNQLLQQQDPLVHRPYSFWLQGTRSLMMASAPHRAASMRAGVMPAQSVPLPPPQPMASGPYLKVQNWKSTVEGHIEALIFFPGFNASLEHSLERLGQFMAMGRFPPHIKPFVFSWPCARELTYMYACDLAESRKTHFALESFLRGLHSAGVRDIHFLAHSAGSRIVTSGLRNGEHGERTALSKLFVDASSSRSDLLRLRTITLLNPDCPLNSFLARDFKAMRRVCDHITVVGDTKDGALYWSERANGFASTLQFIRQWFRCGCVPRRKRSYAICCRACAEGCCRPYRHGVDRPFSNTLAVGRNIFSLYVREGSSRSRSSVAALNRTSLSSSSSSSKRAAATWLDGDDDDDSEADEEQDEHDEHRPYRYPQHQSRHHKKWLDVDVIDTSSMETNVHQLRHAYFDLNKILVEDLHELIVTGKRAAERSLLLHREGNIFSFCQAPACVVNE